MARLVLVVSQFPKLSESFIVSKFLGLLNIGWDVHVVCRQSHNREWERFPELAQHPEARRRVHVVWPPKPRWLAAALTPPALFRTLITGPGYWQRGWPQAGRRLFKDAYLDAELIALKPDLVHFEFGSLAAERMALRQRLNCKITVSFRGYDLNFTALEQPDFYAPVWQRADGLHLLGQHLWRRAQQRGCPPTMPHVLIPPAIDTTFFTPVAEKPVVEVGTAERPLCILSVGRLEWKKGYEYGLQAVRLLQECGIHCEYRIVGDGHYLSAIAFARHQLGLVGHVELLGARPRTEIKSQMAWADLFLHPAVSEGFGNAVLEAQAMQLPVITSDAGGLSENVTDGVTGFVVPRRDAAALADRLVYLAHNPPLRQQLGIAGRHRVLAHFQLSDQIAAFARFYQQILSH